MQVLLLPLWKWWRPSKNWRISTRPHGYLNHIWKLHGMPLGQMELFQYAPFLKDVGAHWRIRVSKVYSCLNAPLVTESVCKADTERLGSQRLILYPLANLCLVSCAMPYYSGFMLWDIVSYSCRMKSGIKSFFLSTGLGPAVWEVCLPRKHF